MFRRPVVARPGLLANAQQFHRKLNGAYVKSFLMNTVDYVRATAADALFLRPFEPTRNEAELFDFNGPHALNEWGLGCDQDIGGHSTARLQLTPENKVRFSGNISLALNTDAEALYSGYAAMRSFMRLPRHLFDNRCHDCSRFLYIKMRVRGDHRTYTFNFRPTRTFSGDLYQCRFKFLKPYEWEEIVLPIEYFIRTNCGAEYMRQYPPNLEKIMSFGFLVGDNLPGPFSLELDYIKLTNLNLDYIREETRHTMDHSILTRNLVDPTKKREDTVDSLKNAFGFGFDMGDGMIETADGARKTRARTNLLPDRVLNDRWKVTIRPEGRVKSRLEVDREEREVEGGEAAKSNVRS